MKDAFIVTALSVIPKNFAARVMGAFARTRFPVALEQTLLRWYVKKYKVNLDECVGQLGDYTTLVDFFTRALRPGVRPVDGGADALVSPVDAMVYAVGAVKDGQLYQSDGLTYSVTELLGGDDRFEHGEYCVLYLSPRDYHRVHTPREGAVTRFHYLPGKLWPVFPAATRRIRDLFARNERLVAWVQTDVGEIAVAMIGAFGVGRMRAVYTDIVTNTGGAGQRASLPTPMPLGRAAELGRFEMGSTVILVLPPGRVAWCIKPGEPVRLGARIGSLIL